MPPRKRNSFCRAETRSYFVEKLWCNTVNKVGICIVNSIPTWKFTASLSASQCSRFHVVFFFCFFTKWNIVFKRAWHRTISNLWMKRFALSKKHCWKNNRHHISKSIQKNAILFIDKLFNMLSVRPWVWRWTHNDIRLKPYTFRCLALALRWNSYYYIVFLHGSFMRISNTV